MDGHIGVQLEESESRKASALSKKKKQSKAERGTVVDPALATPSESQSGSPVNTQKERRGGGGDRE
eukprot:CAMPEP_0182562162 /NCGR_PEP_ID=MMETSP1324-20130603/4540_1 /TAXON_ID=236786 /ORGANISM="Florenciella sp., Strain RCC1587" /LENGTH=65 /DNA_ID=CAMNT_0024775009 /DNA_START=90 /DNA_END=284 /DNA_ORIENTATION=-